MRRSALVALLALWPQRALAQTVSAEDAARHVGEDTTVEGEVANVVCSPLACLLSFTVDFSGFAASIPGDRLARFAAPKETYSGKRVRVRGTIVDRNGRPRIEVGDPGDLQVVGGGGPSAASVPALRIPPPAAAADGSSVRDVVAAPPANAAPSGQSRIVDPGRVTSRAGGPREKAPPPSGDSVVAALSGGPGDAATVEARALQQQIDKLSAANAELSASVQALQERLTVLEQSGGARGGVVDEADLPQRPDYVVPGESALRYQHVKRGWTSERVLRALGAPLNTTTEANGYMTWYYADGRAVTLDPRGRVVSSIGF